MRVSRFIAQKDFDRPVNVASFQKCMEKRLAPALSKSEIVIMDKPRRAQLTFIRLFEEGKIARPSDLRPRSRRRPAA
jgi:hypothetical protein